MSKFTLSDLEKIVGARAGENPEDSYTASLCQKGIQKAAEKLGEEAVETVIAAVSQGPDELTSEAADLLFHLLVVLHVGDVKLDDVMNELRSRTARTGHEEKANR